ncbi:MAG TPA: amino acid adenylation domain-containing protein, partial [Pyrinomonadaceae bacterium]
WQREHFGGEALERQLEYWREQLGRNLPALELPTDRPRPRVQTHRGDYLTVTMPAPLGRQLQELSRREGSTLFMTLLTAFQTLLYRYTRQEDVVVGTDIANRNRGETEDLIGFFVNQLVLRTDLSGDPSLREALRRVREVCLKAYAHQDVPFERLVEELQPERSLGRAPLFQVKFVLQNAPGEALAVEGLEVSPLELENKTAMLDLQLNLTERPEGLKGTWIYSTDLFDAATVGRMAGHFQTLLEGMIADPEASVSRVGLLGEDERRQLLDGWNDTARPYPHDRCVQQLFEERAELTPDAVAVSFGEERVGYAELNRRANQLAHRLRGLGVGPDVTVGICVERSVEMIVGLLGILKAGGAYLPLDPSYPLERLSFMLEDAGTSVLLAQEHLEERLPTHWGHTLFLDAEWEDVARESDENPSWQVSPGHAAYVIYTSGSTGQPKGVVVTHRNLTHSTAARLLYYRRPVGNFLLLPSFSFDSSVAVIFWTLCAGGTLTIPQEGAQRDAAYLAGLVERNRVTHFLGLPSLYSLLLDASTPEALGSLSTVIVAGEACPRGLPERHRAEVPGAALYNEYGPTEGTVWSTVFRFGDDGLEGEPPIGRPIPNVQAYVLDAHRQLVPVGVPGELYIGGEGLARGYLNRPELTREKFVPHPFSAEDGARLYATGDLVSFLPDGNLNFLGRVDHQVKVRGYRVELGEIEAALRQHPAVADCVVAAREDEPGDKRLVAYVVAAAEGAPAASELRQHLREALPEYMVPAAYVTLDELPLSPNGKFDRRALPAPQQAGAEPGRDYVAPRTPVEEVVAAIYAELLNLERTGADDNFFELGGHSLLATQLISRLREVFKVEIVLRSIFEDATVAGVSAAVAEALRAAQGLQLPLIEPAGRGGSLPLSFAQQRLWFIDQLDPDSPAYNLSSAVLLSGHLDDDALRRTLSEIVRRHEALRTTFEEREGQPVQVIREAAPLDLEVEDLSGSAQAEEAARRLVEDEARTPFDLSAGPLVRARLLRLSEEEHVLAVTMHHIVSDGWSMGVLIREVVALYTAYVEGKGSPLAELPVQYADYAAWQREHLAGEALERQLEYWRKQLGGGLPTLELPTDRPRPATRRMAGATERAEMSGVGEALRDLSRREGVTPFMVLLAAWQVLLARYSGQEDIVVGADVANRNRGETEGLIGFF